MTQTPGTDDERFDVTIHLTDGETILREDVAGDVAREFEDLPFTAPEVAVVQVASTKLR
jgi:hypothetical protein